MENQERAFLGIWIEAEIWLNKNLTWIDKIVYSEIESLDGENGCTASNKYLSEFCQCSERKVQDSIAKLIEKGMIEVVAFDGRKRTLKSLRHAKFACLGRRFFHEKRKTTSYYRENSLDNARTRARENSSFDTEEFYAKATKRKFKE